MSFDEALKKFGHIKTKNNTVVPIYEEFLIKRGEKSANERGYLHFHPSSFGDCLRKTAYQYYSEKSKKFKLELRIDPQLTRIFDAGHAFHHRMQSDFAEMGILRGYWQCRSCGKIIGPEQEPNKKFPIGIFLPEHCSCQKKEDKRKGISLFEYVEIGLKSEKKYNFQGNTDGIIELINGDEDSRYIIDFKTINSDRFRLLSEPEHKYIVQVQIYMWLTNLKKSIIYYEEKGKHQIKEFIVNRNENQIEAIKETSEKLNKILQMNKIPSRNKCYSKEEKPCKYCEYKDFCYDEKKVKDLF